MNISLDPFIVIINILGFTGLAFLILLLNRSNRRYYEKFSIDIATTVAKNTILLLGKMDETTDASAMTLNETSRTSRGVRETKEIARETKKVVENAFH